MLTTSQITFHAAWEAYNSMFVRSKVIEPQKSMEKGGGGGGGGCIKEKIYKNAI